MSDHIIPIEKQDFFPMSSARRWDGWRFAQMCAVRTEDGYELSYTLRQWTRHGYAAAGTGKRRADRQHHPGLSLRLLQENEAAELFGVRIKGITMDYKHKLYRIDTETPFAQKGVK